MATLYKANSKDYRDEDCSGVFRAEVVDSADYACMGSAFSDTGYIVEQCDYRDGKDKCWNATPVKWFADLDEAIKFADNY